MKGKIASRSFVKTCDRMIKITEPKISKNERQNAAVAAASRAVAPHPNLKKMEIAPNTTMYEAQQKEDEWYFDTKTH